MPSFRPIYSIVRPLTTRNHARFHERLSERFLTTQERRNVSFTLVFRKRSTPGKSVPSYRVLKHTIRESMLRERVIERAFTHTVTRIQRELNYLHKTTSQTVVPKAFLASIFEHYIHPARVRPVSESDALNGPHQFDLTAFEDAVALRGGFHPRLGENFAIRYDRTFARFLSYYQRTSVRSSEARPYGFRRDPKKFSASSNVYAHVSMGSTWHVLLRWLNSISTFSPSGDKGRTTGTAPRNETSTIGEQPIGSFEPHRRTTNNHLWSGMNGANGFSQVWAWTGYKLVTTPSAFRSTVNTVQRLAWLHNAVGSNKWLSLDSAPRSTSGRDDVENASRVTVRMANQYSGLYLQSARSFFPGFYVYSSRHEHPKRHLPELYYSSINHPDSSATAPTSKSPVAALGLRTVTRALEELYRNVTLQNRTRNTRRSDPFNVMRRDSKLTDDSFVIRIHMYENMGMWPEFGRVATSLWNQIAVEGRTSQRNATPVSTPQTIAQSIWTVNRWTSISPSVLHSSLRLYIYRQMLPRRLRITRSGHTFDVDTKIGLAERTKMRSWMHELRDHRPGMNRPVMALHAWMSVRPYTLFYPRFTAPISFQPKRIGVFGANSTKGGLRSSHGPRSASHGIIRMGYSLLNLLSTSRVGENAVRVVATHLLPMRKVGVWIQRGQKKFSRQRLTQAKHKLNVDRRTPMNPVVKAIPHQSPILELPRDLMQRVSRQAYGTEMNSKRAKTPTFSSYEAGKTVVTQSALLRLFADLRNNVYTSLIARNLESTTRQSVMRHSLVRRPYDIGIGGGQLLEAFGTTLFAAARRYRSSKLVHSPPMFANGASQRTVEDIMGTVHLSKGFVGLSRIMKKEIDGILPSSVRSDAKEADTLQANSANQRLWYRRTGFVGSDDQQADGQRHNDVQGRITGRKTSVPDKQNRNAGDEISVQDDTIHSPPLQLRSNQPSLSSFEMRRLVDRVYRAVMERVRFNQQRRGLK